MRIQRFPVFCFACAVLLAPGALAQLSTDQKVLDFQSLASLYAKRYAPYEWKKTLFHYDALNLTPWLDQVRQTTGDLEYLELLVKYVGALNDTHATYRLPTNYGARLGFTLDSCWSDDGKQNYACITSIDRTVLPSSRYPFVIGDVVLSVDGKNISDYANDMLPFVSAASWDSGWRRAMDLVTTRTQAQYPRLPEVTGNVQVVVQQLVGGQQTYTIPWLVSGTPLLRIGDARSFTATARPKGRASDTDGEMPEYLKAIAKYWEASDKPEAAILGYGSTTPVWTVPSGFARDTSFGSAAEFYIGTMTVRGHKIGYIRLGSFSPTSTTNALNQLDQVIQAFEDNTEGLVFDVMRNTGGSVCYAEEVMARLMTDTWRPTLFRMRAIWSDVSSMASSLALARAVSAHRAPSTCWKLATTTLNVPTTMGIH